MVLYQGWCCLVLELLLLSNTSSLSLLSNSGSGLVTSGYQCSHFHSAAMGGIVMLSEMSLVREGLGTVWALARADQKLKPLRMSCCTTLPFSSSSFLGSAQSSPYSMAAINTTYNPAFIVPEKGPSLSTPASDILANVAAQAKTLVQALAGQFVPCAH
jgi:hypothetical protein